LRSFSSVRSELRIALFDLNTSSRNTIFGLGDHPFDLASVHPFAERCDVDRAEQLVGSVKRVSRYSK